MSYKIPCERTKSYILRSCTIWSYADCGIISCILWYYTVCSVCFLLGQSVVWHYDTFHTHIFHLGPKQEKKYDFSLPFALVQVVPVGHTWNMNYNNVINSLKMMKYFAPQTVAFPEQFADGEEWTVSWDLFGLHQTSFSSSLDSDLMDKFVTHSRTHRLRQQQRQQCSPHFSISEVETMNCAQSTRRSEIEFRSFAWIYCY